MLKKLFSSSLPQEIVLEGTSFKIKHCLRKNMKRMIIRVENKHEIRLSSGKVSAKNALVFLQDNASWILKQHLSLNEVDLPFYYLSKSYAIKHHNKPLYIQDDYVYLNPQKLKLHTDNFYKEQAKAHLPSRVKYWSEKMNVEYNKLGFRLVKKRWGSCNSKRNISLNPYMMKLSYEMIDYIVVHELSHLIHLNHSKQFYQTIEKYLPEHLALEKSIKEFSRCLS